MSYVNLIDPVSSFAIVRPTLDKINGAFCVVPNMFKAGANSLAAKAAVSGGYISQIETGIRDGSFQTIKKIAAALGVNVDDLA